MSSSSVGPGLRDCRKELGRRDIDLVKLVTEHFKASASDTVRPVSE